MGFWKSGQQEKKMKSDFFQIWFKPHMELVGNVIPIGFLQMRLSLDAQNLDFKLFFVSLLTWHTTITSKWCRNAERHPTPWCTVKLATTTALKHHISLLCHWVFPAGWGSSAPWLDRHLFGEWGDAPPLFLHLFWKPYHICWYTCRYQSMSITTRIHWLRLDTQIRFEHSTVWTVCLKKSDLRKNPPEHSHFCLSSNRQTSLLRLYMFVCVYLRARKCLHVVWFYWNSSSACVTCVLSFSLPRDGVTVRPWDEKAIWAPGRWSCNAVCRLICDFWPFPLCTVVEAVSL